ncbi:hypothetical protein ACQRIU_003944 [Beauveria bassiana]
MPIDQSRPDAARPHPDPNQSREPTAGELECYHNDRASFSGMERNVAKATGSHPDDPMFEKGSENVPPGHPGQPGNYIGVPYEDPGTQSPSSSNSKTVTALPGAPGHAEDRCYTSEFDKLVEMGKEILPLVNYMLLNDDNFTAVFLYNALEDDTRYRVDPDDVLNFLTLQRQQNLIVDLNRDRKW